MGEVNLYEAPALRDISGPVIRPGGFELTDRGLSRCRLAPGARVMDVGCGTGAVVDYVRQRHGLAALGLDFSAVLLEEGSRTYYGSPLVRGRAEQLPVLREVRRVLKPGGYLVLADVFAREPAAEVWTGPLPAVCCPLWGRGHISEAKTWRCSGIIRHL